MTPKDVYRVPVRVKYRERFFGWSWWSWKVVAGLELVVGSEAIEVRMRSRALGAILGNRWLFEPTQTRIEVSGAPTPKLLPQWWPIPREWIVISSVEPNKRGPVAVAASGAMMDVWTRLVAARTHAASAPPT